LNIRELFGPDLLELMVEQGFVKRADNGEGLYLYNYTDKAQFSKVWNEVTLVCRGLITDYEGNIVARPFPKFFNHFESEMELENEVEVTDKIDGSLGILYFVNKQPFIATRGSFTSKQAVHAGEIYRGRYAEIFKAQVGITYLFEIVYPENKIVVDYADTDDLILLGGVVNSTGESISAESIGWPGPKVSVYKFNSYAEALKAEPRSNAEGLVVRSLRSGQRIKIKQEEYVRLHLLLSNLSERRVWETLSSGSSLEVFLEGVPDEYIKWAQEWKKDLEDKYKALERDFANLYLKVKDDLTEGYNRREFANAVSLIEDAVSRSALFLLEDKKSTAELIWWQIKPREHIPLIDIKK